MKTTTTVREYDDAGRVVKETTTETTTPDMFTPVAPYDRSYVYPYPNISRARPNDRWYFGDVIPPTLTITC